MTIPEIVEKIQRLDRLMSHGIRSLSIIHLDKYRANRQKKQDLIDLLKSKGYK